MDKTRYRDSNYASFPPSFFFYDEARRFLYIFQRMRKRDRHSDARSRQTRKKLQNAWYTGAISLARRAETTGRIFSGFTNSRSREFRKPLRILVRVTTTAAARRARTHTGKVTSVALPLRSDIAVRRLLREFSAAPKSRHAKLTSVKYVHRANFYPPAGKQREGCEVRYVARCNLARC